jgi:hypothetical protein
MMILNRVLKFMVVVFVVFSLSPAMAQTEFTPSGFLEDYAILIPLSEKKGSYNYRKEGASIRQYPDIVIEPVEIWYDTESPYKGISPDKLAAMTEDLRNIMIQSLVGTVNWVFEPGEGIMSLRMAITNVYAKKPKKRLLNYTPIGLIATGVKKAAGTDYKLKNAILEAELRDSVTGDLLGAVVLTNIGKVSGKEKVKWKEITEDFTTWSQFLKGQMEETLEQ